MPSTPNPAVWALLAIGLCTGLFSGVFGIGGGVLIIPAFVFFLGFSQQRATGTSLALMLPPVGVLAVMEYWRNDNVDVRAALWVAGALAVGAGLGAWGANRLPAAHLRLAFGVFVMGVGAWMVFKATHQMGVPAEQ